MPGNSVPVSGSAGIVSVHHGQRLTRYWWLLALAAVLGGASGLVLSLVMPSTYQASAYVIVVPDESGGELAAISFSQAYGRITEQPEILGTAAAAIGSSVEQLQRDIQASTSPESPLVVLTGSAGTAERAAEIANAVSESLVVFANGQSDTTRVVVSVFSGASSPPVPSSPVLPLNVALGTATGLLVGGLALLAAPARGTADSSAGSSPVPDTPTGRQVVSSNDLSSQAGRS